MNTETRKLLFWFGADKADEKTYKNGEEKTAGKGGKRDQLFARFASHVQEISEHPCEHE